MLWRFLALGFFAVAVLAAYPLFYPRDARRSGRTCMRNLHSLVQALKMYQDDWERLPTGATWDAALYPDYMPKRNEFTCPVRVAPAGPWEPTPEPYRYGLNNFFAGGRITDGNKHLILLFETNQSRAGVCGDSGLFARPAHHNGRSLYALANGRVSHATTPPPLWAAAAFE